MEDDLLPRIQQLKGVAEITLLGGEQREVQVKVDQERLLNRVSLATGNRGHSARRPRSARGHRAHGTRPMTVKLAGKLTHRAGRGGRGGGHARARQRGAREGCGHRGGRHRRRHLGEPLQRREGIGLLIKKQGDANAVDMSPPCAPNWPASNRRRLSGHPLHHRRRQHRHHRGGRERRALRPGLAVVLVSIIMLLFLRSLRNSLIVLVAIPASLVSAFVAMGLFGYTLNLMTLLAMSLIIGILVDDSIVILENIQRYLDKGMDKRSAALTGRAEIGFSALSITLVDVVVFLPIIFVQVFVADLLKQFSVVVVVSTLMSLFVSFTLTPWLASRMGKKSELKPTNPYNRFLLALRAQLDRLNEWYAGKLALGAQPQARVHRHHPRALRGTGIMMKQGIMGKELIATGDQGKFRSPWNTTSRPRCGRTTCAHAKWRIPCCTARSTARVQQRRRPQHRHRQHGRGRRIPHGAHHRPGAGRSARIGAPKPHDAGVRAICRTASRPSTSPCPPSDWCPAAHRWRSP
jgi:HAE1 family hydrophobic/amphiphilic exporter-1